MIIKKSDEWHNVMLQLKLAMLCFVAFISQLQFH